MSSRMRRILTVAALAVLTAFLYGGAQRVRAQSGGLVVTPLSQAPQNLTPADLVSALLGPDVAVSNVTYTGATLAAGEFTGGTGILNSINETPLESGIVLSSGKVVDAVGPNKLPFTQTSFCIPLPGEPPSCVPNGDPNLDQIVAPGKTFDAAVLEFDFVPTTNVVKFRYVFSSEEYNEFANSLFNNVFGFYVNGVNYALLPDGITPVSINNVNGGNPFGTNPHHPEFFRNNEGAINLDGTVTNAPINIEADGLTVILTFTAPVIPGFTNHMKLAIADTQDHVYDSWAFLEQATFTQIPEICGNNIDDNFNGFVDEGCSQESEPQTVNQPNETHTFTFTGLGSTNPLSLSLIEGTTLRSHRLKVIATIFDPRDLQLPLTNPAVFPFGTTCLPTNTIDGSERPCVFFSVVDPDTGQPPIAGVDYDVAPGAVHWVVDTAVTKPVNGDVGMGHFRSDMVTSPVDFVDENIILIFDNGEGTSDNYSGVTLTVTPPTAPPTISLPGNLVAEATGPGGANVTYDAKAYGPVASPEPGSEPVFKAIPISCDPSSGSLFPLAPPFGPTTTVTCSVTAENGKTATGSFLVTVQDTTPPHVTVPADIVAEATGFDGAPVSYPAATAHDIVDGDLIPACSPSSGSTFPLGVTTVNCSAMDFHHNTGTGSFKVTVTDTTPPTLTLPADIQVPATSSAGAIVMYSATAMDSVNHAVTPVCAPISGSLFPLGTTTVQCTATDAHLNHSNGSFKVTVGCCDVKLSVNPTSASRGQTVMLTVSASNFTKKIQIGLVKFDLTTPCSHELMGSFPVLLLPGKHGSITVSFKIPKQACVGTYTFTSSESFSDGSKSTHVTTLAVH